MRGPFRPAAPITMCSGLSATSAPPTSGLPACLRKATRRSPPSTKPSLDETEPKPDAKLIRADHELRRNFDQSYNAFIAAFQATSDADLAKPTVSEQRRLCSHPPRGHAGRDLARRLAQRTAQHASPSAGLPSVFG